MKIYLYGIIPQEFIIYMVSTLISPAANSMDKQGQKGSEIEHFSIQMADYLSPNNTGLTIEEKQNMFSVINRMTKISYNFPHTKNRSMFLRTNQKYGAYLSLLNIQY